MKFNITRNIWNCTDIIPIQFRLLVLDDMYMVQWQNTLTQNGQPWEGIKYAEDKQQTGPGRKGWKLLLTWESTLDAKLDWGYHYKLPTTIVLQTFWYLILSLVAKIHAACPRSLYNVLHSPSYMYISAIVVALLKPTEESNESRVKFSLLWSNSLVGVWQNMIPSMGWCVDFFLHRVMCCPYLCMGNLYYIQANALLRSPKFPSSH